MAIIATTIPAMAISISALRNNINANSTNAYVSSGELTFLLVIFGILFIIPLLMFLLSIKESYKCYKEKDTFHFISFFIYAMLLLVLLLIISGALYSLIMN